MANNIFGIILAGATREHEWATQNARNSLWKSAKSQSLSTQ